LDAASVECRKADTIPRSTVLFGLGSLFFCLPMFHDGVDVLTELGAAQGVKLAGWPSVPFESWYSSPVSHGVELGEAGGEDMPRLGA